MERGSEGGRVRGRENMEGSRAGLMVVNPEGEYERIKGGLPFAS